MFRYVRKVMSAGRDRGASAVEYGLMVAAIAAVIVGVVFGLGKVVNNVFTNTCSSIATQAKADGCVATPATPPG